MSATAEICPWLEIVSRISVKLKLLSDTAKLPTYGSAKAACCDLYADIKSLEGAPEKIYIGPGDVFKVPTGIAIQPPNGWCSLIYARSGISVKKGLRPSNAVGVCDEDYTGEYIVALRNDSHEIQVVEQGDRVAQLMFVPYTQADFEIVGSLDETTRGSGGFGSSGIK